MNNEMAQLWGALYPQLLLMKDRLPGGNLSEKINKYYCPENCESLTKVCVNQAVWDNLSPSVCSQDVKMQKVRLCLKAYVP